MTADVLTLAEKHLTIFEACLGVLVLAGLLFRRRHAFVVWWATSMALLAVFTFLLCRAASAVYRDPRAVTIAHLKGLSPLVPFLPHLPRNSFPSSHAVLAGLIVSAVLFVNMRWAIPFAILGPLDTYARTGFGPHQAIDVGGAWLIVAIAAALAFLVGSIMAAVVLPSIPPSWTAERFRLRRSQRLGLT
jgi:hypothetical protein